MPTEIKEHASILPYLPDCIQIEVACQHLDNELEPIWQMLSTEAKKAFVRGAFRDDRLKKHLHTVVSDPSFLAFDTDLQVGLAWLPNDSSLWRWLADSAKVLFIYRCLAESRALPAINDSSSVISLQMLDILLKDRDRQESFATAHSVLQKDVIDVAWKSSDFLDMRPLLPKCFCPVESKVKCCEGRPWLTQQERQARQSKASRAFCPRTGRECSLATPSNPEGARIYADTKLPWNKWSLAEVLTARDIVPHLPELDDGTEYVPRLSGWINRLNEIRERLKCSVCGLMMKPNYAYAKNLARYNVTVVSCAEGEGHDKDIYLNHCWGCNQVIDSRESRFRVEAYYICIHCGSGPQNSMSYCHGDVCPKDGALRMKKLGDRDFQCSKCLHRIHIPPAHRLTGSRAQEIARG